MVIAHIGHQVLHLILHRFDAKSHLVSALLAGSNNPEKAVMSDLMLESETVIEGHKLPIDYDSFRGGCSID